MKATCGSEPTRSGAARTASRLRRRQECWWGRESPRILAAFLPPPALRPPAEPGEAAPACPRYLRGEEMGSSPRHTPAQTAPEPFPGGKPLARLRSPGAPLAVAFLPAAGRGRGGRRRSLPGAAAAAAAAAARAPAAPAAGPPCPPPAHAGSARLPPCSLCRGTRCPRGAGAVR